jgi:hypothetical protein
MRRPVAPKGSTIVGLDLSLRAAAACALPHRWNHSLKRVKVATFGGDVAAEATPLDRVQRLHDIANGIVDFCRKNQASHVWTEEFAFSQKQSQSHALGEGGGVVKLALYQQLGLVVIPVVASSARKLMLQHLPKSDVKTFTHWNIRQLGAPIDKWNGDEIDAFVVANFGLSELGYAAMSWLGER